jgi:DNA-binding NarL/FixJ family response regulator
MINLVIAEDQVVLRECLNLILKQDNEIEVVGCAGNGEEAFELCNQFKPDLVLLDIVMPVCDGIEALRLIKEKYPEIKVIMLTTFDNDENVQKALKFGADGYILKGIRPAELITVIKSTMKGMQIIDQNVYNTIVKRFNNNDHDPKTTVPEPEVFPELTDREVNIIRLIVQGKSNKEIATNIFLSETRVKSIITQILRKLKVEDRTQLAVYAVKNNLVGKIINKSKS